MANRGLIALAVGALMTCAGLVGAIGQINKADSKISNSNYERIENNNYNENWKCFAGLEALGVTIMIGSGMYLNKKKINWI